MHNFFSLLRNANRRSGRRYFLPLLLGLVCASLRAHADVSVAPLATFFGTNGAASRGGLIQATNGSLYGMTFGGGDSSLGTVFRVSPDGVITRLVSFNGNNGAQPLGELLQGVDGNLYGTTSSGGTFGYGTIFKMTLDGTLTTIFAFDGTSGASPQTGLIQDAAGTLYGVASSGGASAGGTVFAITPAGTVTFVQSFAGYNGSDPLGTLVMDAAGDLFGTTASGGTNGLGTVFEVPIGGAITTLHAFTGGPGGLGPQAGLVLASDGNLYGTTASGGTPTNGVSLGTLFQLSPLGTFNTLFTFTGATGSQPSSRMFQSIDGSLYGTTAFGGANQKGTIFKMTLGGAFSTLYSFKGGNDGANPYGALIQATNLGFYGTASAAGKGGVGTVWQVTGFAPLITVQPTAQAVLAGATVSLSVGATGTAPLTYQWLLNSNNIANKGNVSGANTATLLITNVSTANAGNYSVIIANSSGSVTSSVVQVSINERPTLHISSPGDNAVLTKSALTVRGATSGSAAVAAVFYQLNGSGWLTATPGKSFSSWSADVVLSPGANVFQAYALDVVGANSLTNTRTFFFGGGTAPLTVQIHGSGKVTPDDNGKTLSLFHYYTLNAVPAPGYLFAGWSGSVVTNSARLTFLMQTNLVLEADFVANPFVPLVGSYNGLFFDTNEVANASSGFLTLSLTSKGSYSGSLSLSGARSSFTGQLNPATGLSQTTIKQRTGPALVLSLQADLSDNSAPIVGTVSGTNWSAMLEADRAVFSTRSNPSPLAGQYTLILPGSSDPSAGPAGDGFATFSVDKNGKAMLSGQLADGTAITESATLSSTGALPFFVSPYAGQGVALGWLDFSNASAPSDFSGTVEWLKTFSARSKNYPLGFTNQSIAVGAPYAKPGRGATVLSASNLQLVFTDGNLTSAFTNLVTVASNGRVSNSSANKLSLTFNTASGSFKGTVVPPGATKALSFSGAVLQDENAGYGFFLNSASSGAVGLSAITNSP